MAVLFLALAPQARGDAIVSLNNYDANQPIWYLNSGTLALPTGVQVEVWGGPVGGALAPTVTAGGASRFVLSEPGYFDSGYGLIAGLPDKAPGQFQVRVWKGAATFDAAPFKGVSAVFIQNTGANPPPPLLPNPVPLQIPGPILLSGSIPGGTPPAIQTAPTDTNVLAGNNLALTVEVYGSLPLSFQWKFNEANLPQGTNGTLVLGPAQLAQAGRYSVAINNAFGATVTSPATVTVVAPPTISLQPQAQGAMIGGTAIFQVVASGTAPLAYQWYFNGVRREGANQPNLVLNNVQPEQAGDYLVIVSNPLGALASQPAHLDVGYKLAITAIGPGQVQSNPNQTVYAANSTVQLMAVANSNAFFIGWSGDVAGANNPLTVTLNTNLTVTATFIAPRLLTTSTSLGGTILRHPDRANYLDGDTVQLTAAPAPGFVFAGWSGAASGTNNPLTITINGNQTIGATFGDVQPPALFLTSPVAGNSTSSVVSLSGSVTDNVGVVSLTWARDGQAQGSLGFTNQAFSIPGLRLHRGENQFGVFAQDAAGNQSQAEVRVIGGVGNPLGPRLSSFAPLSAPTGASLTLVGTNFDPFPVNNRVYFGTARAAVSSLTSTSLTVTVPVGALYAAITVVTSAGLSGQTPLAFLPSFNPTGPVDNTAFAPKVDFAFGNGGRSLGLGDLNMDGRLDVLVANSNSAAVATALNAGAAGAIDSSLLTAAVTFPVGNNPAGLAVADLDGDGQLEVVVANSADNTVSVLRDLTVAGAAGPLVFAPKIDFPTGNQPVAVAIADIDGDGKPDLVVANQAGRSLSILRNLSRPGQLDATAFAPKVDYPVSAPPLSLALGDLNGDGLPEIVVGLAGTSVVAVFPNLSVPGVIDSYSLGPEVDLATGGEGRGVALGDLDGDGLPELVVANANGSTVSILRNTGTLGPLSTNSFAPRVDFPTGAGPCAVALGDINGDGKPDLATANLGAGTVSLLVNSSTSGHLDTSSFGAHLDFGAGAQPHAVALADLDGNGRPDLVVLNSSAVSVLRNLVGPTQTINFAPLPNRVYGDSPFSLLASASAGLPVSFSIGSGPAVVNGSVVTLTGAGTVVVRAAQAGNDTYRPAPAVDQSFAVAKAPQTISFGPLADHTLGDAPLALAATSSAGLPVTFSVVSGPATVSGNLLTISGGGPVVIRAAQGGNSNYLAAPNVDQSFNVQLVLTTPSPRGGMISRSPDLLRYAYGATVQLTATPSPGYVFVNWGGGASGTNPVVSLLMNSNQSVSATFTPVWSLTTSSGPGGTIVRSPDLPLYLDGTAVLVTAIPNTNYVFNQWGGQAAWTNNPLSLMLTTDLSVTASFLPTYRLAATTAGQGTVSPSPLKDRYVAGDIVQLSAVAGSGFVFTGWSGAVSGTNATVSLLMDRDQSISATFAPVWTLTTAPGTGGTITRSPDLAVYLDGTTVLVTALPNTNFVFNQWGGQAAGTSNPLRLTLTTNLSVTASFLATYRLVTTVVGQGTVSLSPSKDRYVAGEAVQLSATPTAGFSFVNWSGAISAAQTMASLMMDSDKSVTASFRDSTPPTIVITSPTTGVVGGSRLVLSGSITDNVGVVAARWKRDGQDMGALVLANGQFNLPNLVLDAGQNEFLILADDAAGNEGTAEVVVNWQPLVFLESGSYRLTLSGFTFILGGQTGLVYTVESSTDLASWSPLLTVTNTLGRLQLLDPSAPQYPRRFYRAVLRP